MMLVELSGAAGRRFPRDRLFDQSQAVLDVLEADEVRNHGAIGGILVVGAFATPSPAAFCMGALLSYFFRSALLLVR